MRRVVEYLNYEDQCQERAAKQIKPNDRRALEWMTQTWAKLARERQDRQEKEERGQQSAASLVGLFVSKQSEMRPGDMLSRDRAMRYRMHALRCQEIAEHISDPENRLSILALSRAWHASAEQYELAEPITPPRGAEDELLSEVDWY